jgi:hypothetical protein
MHSKQVIRLLNEHNSEEVEENRTFSDNDDNVESNKTHNLLNDKEINNFLLEHLIKRQRQIFDTILQWGKNFIKNEENFQPFHIFLTGGGGVDKSHLINCIL